MPGPALFLDRDGVVNVDHGYVCTPDRFELVDGIDDLCRRFAAAGYRIVIVTNQAGIGRGYYTVEQFLAFTAWMVGSFATRGIEIARVYHCPFHPTEGIGNYRRDSYDRKPNPGMLFRARDELALDLAGSVLVGDKASDIEAARAAGVGHPVLFDPEAIGNAATSPPGIPRVRALGEIAPDELRRRRHESRNA